MIGMPLEKKLHRLDLTMKIEKIIDENSEELVVRVHLVPNPERYVFATVNGEEGYIDKFDHSFMPIEELKKALPQLEGMPIYWSEPKITDIDEYIKERKSHIQEFIEKKFTPYKFQDKSEGFLSALERDKMRFVILVIDLKGSTRMSQELTLEDNAQIISLYSREMALLVENFNGFVLKYVGDGLIAYFPEPNLIGMTDNALDCAASMKRMILLGINPILKQKGLPELGLRIGLDSGEAAIMTIGAESIKTHKDLIGETINLSAKIQGLAGVNQIFMGEATALCLHTFWRQRVRKVDFPSEKWNYKSKATGEIYPIYSLIEFESEENTHSPKN
jgi:adenylate cyclase